MTWLLLLLASIAFAVAIFRGGGDPPDQSAGEWINDHAYQQALREARLRRVQRF